MPLRDCLEQYVRDARNGPLLDPEIRSRSRRGDDSDGSEDFSFGTERSLDLSQAGLEDAFPENVPPFLRWVEIFSKKVNIPREQWRAPMPAPLAVGTGCSCTGAPVYALECILGRPNVAEEFASEKHARTRKWLMDNYSPEHVFKDITSTRTGGYCMVHKQTCPPVTAVTDEGSDWSRVGKLLCLGYCAYWTVLTTNSKPYVFQRGQLLNPSHMMCVHGFDTRRFRLEGPRNLYSLLSGNCMSVPVVGACLCSVLLLADLGGSNQHLRFPPSRVGDLVRSSSCFSFGCDDSDHEDSVSGEVSDCDEIAEGSAST